MDETEVWSAIDQQRSRFADLVAAMTPAELATPSLCDGWTTRDVAAHLTMLTLSTRQLLGLALRHPGGTNRLIREGSIDLGRRFTTDEITARLRSLVGDRRTMPGLGSREALLDVLAHTYDVTIPLGIEADLPRDALAESADRLISYGTGRNSKVFRQLPWRGHRLVATDHDWSHGEGPVIEDSMGGLFLLLTGREPRRLHESP